MTKNTSSKPCSICGKDKKLKIHNGRGICTSCTHLSEYISTDPSALKNLIEQSGLDIDAISTVSTNANHQDDPDLPDVLDGVRYRTTDRERNTWYVSVSELEGNPVEIFASTAFENDHHLQSRISNLTTITRLISLILRHVFMGENLTLAKTLTQLKRSSRQPNDLPEMLGGILSKYTREGKTVEEKEENFIP